MKEVVPGDIECPDNYDSTEYCDEIESKNLIVKY